MALHAPTLGLPLFRQLYYFDTGACKVHYRTMVYLSFFLTKTQAIKTKTSRYGDANDCTCDARAKAYEEECSHVANAYSLEDKWFLGI